MKKTLFIPFLTIVAALSFSCSKEENEGPASGHENNEETGLFESQAAISASSAVTKTILDGVSIKWEADDAISLFDAERNPVNYTLTEGEGTTIGKFEKDGVLPGQVLAYAVYPAVSEDVAIADNKVAISIAASQVYMADGFPTEYPMAAVTEDGQNFLFENLATVVSLPLKGDNVTVKSVTLETADGSSLAGPATIDFTSGSPVLSASSDKGSSAITLDCGAGVQLTDDGLVFNFIVIPGTYDGLKITVKDTDGNIITTKSTDAEVSFRAGTKTALTAIAISDWVLYGNFTNAENEVWANYGHFTGISRFVALKNVDIVRSGATFQIHDNSTWYGSSSKQELNKGLELSAGTGNTYIGDLGTGNFDFYFDTKTKYVFVMGTEKSPFRVEGAGAEWGESGTLTNANMKMTEDGLFVAENVTFTNKTEFKIMADETAWSGNYEIVLADSWNPIQTNTAVNVKSKAEEGNAGNIIVEEQKGPFDIWFNPDLMQVCIMTPGQTPVWNVTE